MNCASVRNRILAKTHPDKLPTAYKAHVHTCPACQAWHRQIVAVEQAVAAVVVPASSEKRKANFIKEFLATPPVVHEPVAVAVAEAPKPPKVNKPKSTPKAKVASSPKVKTTPASVTPKKPRQPLSERLTRMWPAGIAAVLVLGGAIIWSMKGGHGPTEVAAAQRDPMLEKAVKFKVDYDTALTDADKMKALLKFSDDIHDQAKTMAKVAPGADMDALAKMYEQIVSDTIVRQARSMDVAQNKQLLTSCVEQLGKIEQDANRLAVEVPTDSIKPLRTIAKAAKEGKEKIAQRLTSGKAI